MKFFRWSFGNVIPSVYSYDCTDQDSVDGRTPAPVEVGSLSHYLQGFLYIQTVVGLGISEPWSLSSRRNAHHQGQGRMLQTSCYLETFRSSNHRIRYRYKSMFRPFIRVFHITFFRDLKWWVLWCLRGGHLSQTLNEWCTWCTEGKLSRCESSSETRWRVTFYKSWHGNLYQVTYFQRLEIQSIRLQSCCSTIPRTVRIMAFSPPRDD